MHRYGYGSRYVLSRPFGVGDELRRTFYVSADGSDAADGRSQATPWQTLGPLATAGITAGDRILLRSGDTFSGALYFAADGLAGGSAGRPVTVGSYGGGRATISVGSGEIGVFAYNVGWLEVVDLIFSGPGITDEGSAGVVFYSDTTNGTRLGGVRVYNCDTHDFGAKGIQLGRWSEAAVDSYDDPVIDACHVYDCCGASDAESGISTFGFPGLASQPPSFRNLRVTNCVVNGCTGAAGVLSPCGSGIVLGECEDSLIENCVAYDNGENNDYTSGPIGIWMYDCTRTRINLCSSYENKTTAVDGGGYDIDGGCTDCVVENSYSRDNYGAGLMFYAYSSAVTNLFTGNVIRNCVSINDGLGPSSTFGGIFVGNQKSGNNFNNKIYGNVVIGPSAASRGFGCAGSLLGSSNYGCTIANNIFLLHGASSYLVDAGTANPTGLTFVNNCYWSPNQFRFRWNNTTYTTMAAWRAASGQETLSGASRAIVADPLLVDRTAKPTLGLGWTSADWAPYRLQDWSPCRDGGLDLAAQYGWTVPTTDIFGATIPTGTVPDIGVAEMPVVAYDYAGFINGQANGLYFNALLTSSTWQDTAATTPADDATEPIGRIDDLRSGTGSPHNATQSTSGQRPLRQSTGAKFDGSDDRLVTDYVAARGANFIVARVVVPASVAATQVIAGATAGGATRAYLGIQNPGQPAGGVANHTAATITAAVDIRGLDVVLGISWDGATVRLWCDDDLVYEAAQDGTPTESVVWHVGGLNNNGTSASWFAGSIKGLRVGRRFLTTAEYLAERAGLIALG